MKQQHIESAQLFFVALAISSATPVIAADGKAVYGATCAVCHASGVAGAPKLGDKAAWQPRVASGEAALVTSVLKGKGAMPAKGGNGALSDEDVKAAVAFMVGQSR